MEISKQEIVAIQETTEQSSDKAIQALSDLELVMVGGGTGDVAIG